MATGSRKVVPETDDLKDKVVAVIGDSTFFHSGVTGLMDMVWNRGNAVVIIQDNRITGMTGGQENPGPATFSPARRARRSTWRNWSSPSA